jgi:hypothetical protein
MTANDQLGKTFNGTVVGCFKAPQRELKKTTENLRGTAGLRFKNPHLHSATYFHVIVF